MKPILFSTEMVRAILDGRKTQTRRIIKSLPPKVKDGLEVVFKGVEVDKAYFASKNDMWHITLPYQPGDILWVRETWAEVSSGIIEYKATYKEPYTGSAEIDHIGNKIKWRPSIRMPREAARIFLLVTNVRVERLWDITETDVRKEGFSDHFDIETDTFYPCGYFFKQTWNSMYATRGCGWDTNPWVWVISFERISKEEAIELDKVG